MKINDILNESITFNVAHKEQHPKYGEVISPVGKRGPVECYGCDGSGKNEYGMSKDDKCDVCRGEGTIEGFKAEGPELNVSNSNAAAIMQALGLTEYSDEYGGGLLPEKALGDFRQKLMRLLNSEKSQQQMTKPSSVEKSEPGAMGVRGREGNVTSIGRRGGGPTIYHGGRSQEQIQRYARTLLDMVEYAMKNGHFISWA